jgi:NADPH:quinone reductase
MKAIRVQEVGGPEVLLLKDVPDLKPGPGQVVVRIRAAGVNPVETYIRAGTYARKATLPYTPGTDGAGTIESVGEGVANVKVADRVYLAGSLTGTYAEQALCEAWAVFHLPANVSSAQGAAMHVPYATAYRALFQIAHVHPGDTVLIHGASGGVGIAAVQIARAAGLHVVGTASSDRGKKLVLAEGAHEVVDHSSPEHFDQALALTGGRGFDVVLELMANINLGRDLPILAHAGRVVIIGSRKGNPEIAPRDIMGKDGGILAMSLWNATPADLKVIHAALVAGLENKSLRPVIGQEFPLAEAPRAHAAIVSAEGSYGKIVLIP